MLICGEPTSSLDVSVQAQTVNLLLEADRSRDLPVPFFSHDLDLIGRDADTLAVMYRQAPAPRIAACSPNGARGPRLAARSSGRL